MPNDSTVVEFPAPVEVGPYARAAMSKPIILSTTGLTWLVVHGAMCLALRHPDFDGPLRDLALRFVRALGMQLVLDGVLTKEQLRECEKVEQQESPHGAG